MSALSSNLEPSQGPSISNPTQEQILSVLNRFGKDLEHCNFTYGNSFVSASGDAQNGIYLYYVDEAGTEFNSDEALDPEAVCRVFLDAREGKSDWRTRVRFAAGAGAPGQPAAGGPGAESPQPGPKSFKDQLLDSVKGEAARSVNRLVRNGVRGLFRKKF